jgi:hypothetical protein
MALAKIPKQPRSTPAQPAPQRSLRSQPTPAQLKNQNSPADLLALQGAIGNRALQRMLTTQGIQAKLSVGPADDVYEREADKVAAQVVDGSAESPSTLGSHSSSSVVQPKSSGGDGGGFETSSGLEGRVNSSKGSGGPLPGETQSFMESRFGADFSGVRIHTGNDAIQLNRSIHSDAFTHGNDIYFNKNQYEPQSRAGQQLLAHELTHVVQQGATSQIHRKTSVSVQNRLSGNRISTKKQKMYLDFVRMKRRDPQFSKAIGSILGIKKLKKKGGEQSGGTYGHWWTEIGDMEGDYPGEWKPAESYGWWPSKSVGLKETFAGVPGSLNKGQKNDPHHGEDVSASQMFHPVMEVDTGADYVAVRDKVINDIRTKAKSYSGKWAWRFGWGQNCHTFQQWLKKQVGIHNQKGVGWLKRPKDVEGIQEAAAKQQEKEQQEEFNKKNPGVDYKLSEAIRCSLTFDGDTDIEIPADSVVRALDKQMFGTFEEASDFNKIEFSWQGKSYYTYKDIFLKAGVKI